MKTAKIEINEENSENLEDLLAKIFWKEPELVKTAGDFLEHIKSWGRSETPYSVKEWEAYCTRQGITQSTYHNMLKRLRSAGMLEKTYNRARKTHEIRLVDNFSESLESMASVWNDYLKK